MVTDILERDKDRALLAQAGRRLSQCPAAGIRLGRRRRRAGRRAAVDGSTRPITSRCWRRWPATRAARARSSAGATSMTASCSTTRSTCRAIRSLHQYGEDQRPVAELLFQLERLRHRVHRPGDCRAPSTAHLATLWHRDADTDLSGRSRSRARRSARRRSRSQRQAFHLGALCRRARAGGLLCRTDRRGRRDDRDRQSLSQPDAEARRGLRAGARPRRQDHHRRAHRHARATSAASS